MLAWILCILLIVINIILIIKILLLHADINKICQDLSELLAVDTNNSFFLNTSDRYIRLLAKKLDTYLKELRKEKQKFQTGNRELNDAVVCISHDLRTPLTAICGYLELLEQEEKTDEVKKYLEQIRNRTEAIKQLTEELFRYSVISSIETENKEQLILNKVLEDNLLSYYGAFHTKNISPVINICDKQVQIEADKVIVNRIIDNILSNVVKYSEGDLLVDMYEDGQIVFKNTAKNLSQTEVCRLFDRFYTVSTGRNSTGLGLSIAKMLVERMGGEIIAEYQDSMLSIKLFTSKHN